MLTAEFTSQFLRDIKRLRKKHVDTTPLREVIALIVENSDEAKSELRRRHKAHVLKGDWAGSFECHVANAGDWLLIWKTSGNVAVLIRTGSHEELFR